jgi:hypothetical protein
LSIGFIRAGVDEDNKLIVDVEFSSAEFVTLTSVGITVEELCSWGSLDVAVPSSGTIKLDAPEDGQPTSVAGGRT